MVHICKGFCVVEGQLVTKKSVRGDKDGFKRCSQCELYIKWDGLFCPCCKRKFKISPRNNKARQAYRERNLK